MDTNTSIQQKAAQALSEINKLEGEDNLFQLFVLKNMFKNNN